jgi:hypothetical protein
VRKALLNPVAVEAQFIEQCGSRPSEIMNREWRKGQTVLLRLLDNRIGHPIERRARHRRVRVIARRQEVSRISGARLQRDHDIKGLA